MIHANMEGFAETVTYMYPAFACINYFAVKSAITFKDGDNDYNKVPLITSFAVMIVIIITIMICIIRYLIKKQKYKRYFGR